MPDKKNQITAQLTRENAELRRTIEETRSSRTWRWTAPIRGLLTASAEFRGRIARALRPFQSERPLPPPHTCIGESHTPLISVLTPVFNPQPAFLKEAIRSVVMQCARQWELILVSDGEPDARTLAILDEAARADARIRFDSLPAHGGISAATNRALELSRGTFIALLDHDDLLHPNALCEVARCLIHHPDADMIYTDEDKVDVRGRHFDHFFKPDWSPERLLSQMYTCHLSVYRRRIAREIGGFRSEYDGAQDHDFALRFSERTDVIRHIPRIFYHWRAHAQSSANGFKAKPAAFDAGRRVVEDALRRRGICGRVDPVSNAPGVFQPRLTPMSHPLVSIIVPTRDGGPLLEDCLASIHRRTTYESYEVIVVDNGSHDRRTLTILDRWVSCGRARVVRIDIPFNHSTLCNRAAADARGDYLVLLNDDVTILSPDWIQDMLGFAEQPGIGAVGGILLHPDDRIQHAGVILGIGNAAGHAFRNYPDHRVGYFSQLATVANYTTVTAAFLMVEKKKYHQCGGFDEQQFPTHFNDVDFCLRLYRKGYRQVVLPYVRHLHLESATRRDAHTLAAAIRQLQRRWQPLLERDPYYNPNLSLEAEDYRLLPQPRY